MVNAVDTEKKYILLKDLQVYQLARELSREGWVIYQSLDWHDRKIMGDQFITATDSTGANIAEGYGRFHYLEKIKFYYNARASLIEAIEHWLDLLRERGKVTDVKYKQLRELADKLAVKLNNFITSTYRSKQNDSQ